MQSEVTLPPQGVIVPLLTPLTDDAKLDVSAFRRLIGRALGAGVHGIFVGGSAGMGPMLTQAQWEHALESAAQEIDGKALLLAGIITPSTQLALRQIALSRRLGCPAIVVTPTFYIALQSDAEMLTHFEACRDATDQEMVLYNIPSCTQSVVSPAVVRHAAEKGWSRAIKESSGDRDYFSRILALGQELGMSVLEGHEPDISWGLQQGASGIVPVCANCEPATFAAAVDAARKGDLLRLERLQSRIDSLREVLLLGGHNWISGLFCALHALGIGNGKPLLPLQPVDTARRQLIEALVADIAERELSGALE